MKWRHASRLFFVLLSIVFTSILLVATANADDNSLWVNSGDPTIISEGSGAYKEIRKGLRCSSKEVTIFNSQDEPSTYSSKCMQRTPYGEVEFSYGTSLFTPANSESTGRFGTHSGVVAVPNDPRLFQLRKAGDYDHFVVYGTTSTPEITKWANGLNGMRDVYDFDTSNATYLKDSDGQNVELTRGHLAFSQNGKWMLARTADNTLVRVDLETFEILPAYDIGTSFRGHFEFAISNDGRYGYFTNWANTPSKRSYFVDFATCDIPSEQGSLDVVDGCGIQDIGSVLAQYNDGNKGSRAPEFSSDNTSVSVDIFKDSAWKRIALVAPDEEYSGLDYLALGDSFASGEGDLPQYYESGTNVSINDELPKGEKCRISTRSYPYLLAKQMGVAEGRFASVACSGAEIEDIINKSDNQNDKIGYKGHFDQYLGLHDNELRAIKNYALENFIPGRAAQIEFVEKYKPKVITISIGGNDVGFSDILGECALPAGLPPGSTCDHAGIDAANRANLAHEIKNTLSKELDKIYHEINDTSPNSKIYVLSYSKILATPQTCGNLAFNARERQFIDESFSYMNSVIEAAAQRAGVQYVDIEDALGEAALCGEEEPKAVNKLLLGNDVDPLIPNVRFIDASSYHPNHHGHRMIANRITRLIPNLLDHSYACSPYANLCPQDLPAPAAPAYFDIDTRNTDRPLHQRFLDRYQYTFEESVEIIQHNVFAPLSDVQIELWSEPQTLGEFTTDETGTLSENITLPEDVPAGYHTIHLKGTLLSGEKADFYQTILILGEEGDRDNNGIADSKQDCIEAPVAVTDDERTLYPCGVSIEEEQPNNPDTTPHPGDLPSTIPDHAIQQATEQLWHRFQNSSYYRQLSEAEQREIASTFTERAKLKLRYALSHCNTTPWSLFSHLALHIRCQKSEDGIQLSISLRIGIFHFQLLPITIHTRSQP